jgi:predicted permease
MIDTPIPPRLLRAVVSRAIPVDERHALLEDLDDLYATRHRNHGRRSANAWYLRQTVGFVFQVGTAQMTDAVSSDIAHAMRSFKRRPAFTVAFLVTLAVGTGVLATVYAAARWVLLRPVDGVGAPKELVTIRLGSREAPPFVSFNVSHADLQVLRDRLPVRGALAGVTPIEVDVRSGNGDPQRVAGEMVTANYFSVLRASLGSGQHFQAVEDDARFGVTSVILSDHYARALSADDPKDMLGTEVRINGALVRVVGIAQPGFRGAELPARSELWLPLSALPIIDPSVDMQQVSRRDYTVWRRMIARPAEGTAVDAVEAAANHVMEEIRAEFGGAHSFLANHFRMQAFPGVGLDPGVRTSVIRTLSLLSGAAALLLALAIANLTSLALVQATSREGATAIRLALGATRARIARALVVETMLLGLSGGIVALLLAGVWSRWFQQARLDERGASLIGMHLDAVVIVSSLLAALFAAVVASISPLRLIWSGVVERVLRREAVGTSTTHRTRSVLVAVQVGISVILLVTAALLGRTVNNLRSIDLGFAPDRMLTFSLDPHLHGYESKELDRLARDLAQQIARTPGALNAAFVSPTPLGSSYFTSSLYASPAADAEPVIGAGYFVTPGFIATMGLTVIAGDMNWRADSATVVISRGTLAKLLPGMMPQQAVGAMLSTRRGGRNAVRIAAVIDDVKLSDITSEPPPVILRPLAERYKGASMSGVVRSAGNPLDLVNPVRAIARSGAPELPLFGIRSVREAIDQQFAERHAMARTASTLGAIGLLLAAIGLYGVLSHIVASRKREFGIRSALGASPVRILRMVAVTALVPVAFGAAAGLGASAWGTRLLSTQLYAMERLDALSYVGAVGALLVAALCACLVPAFRAVRVSPAEVLREQ